MSTEGNKKIIASFFERFSAADAAGALELLDDFYHFLATVSNGRITALREYMDTHQVKQLFIDS